MAQLTDIRNALWNTLDSLDVKTKLTPTNSHLFYDPEQTPAIGQLPALELIPKSVSFNWQYYQVGKIDYTLTCNVYSSGVNLIRLEKLWHQAYYKAFADKPLRDLLVDTPTVGSPVLDTSRDFNKWSFDITCSRFWNPFVPQFTGDKYNFTSGYMLTNMRHLVLDSIEESIGSEINKLYKHEVKGPRYDATMGDLPAVQVLPASVTNLSAQNDWQTGRYLQYGLNIEVMTKWYDVTKGEDLWEKLISGLYQNQRLRNAIGSNLWGVTGTSIIFPDTPQMTLWQMGIVVNTLWGPQNPLFENLG